MTRKNKYTPKQKSMRRRIGLALIPQRANDYQPLAIRRYGLLMVLFFIVVAQAVYNYNQAGSVLGESANVSVEALVRETNVAREEHKLEDLTLSQKLNQAAHLKAKDMFDKQYWGHIGPDGAKPWKWLIEADYGYSKAGENLAKNFYTAEAVNAAWMNSPEHRTNILEPDYTEVGFAIASGKLDGKTTTIVVALYGRPSGMGVIPPSVAVASAQTNSLNLVTRLGIGLQSVTPAALGSIVLLTFLMMIAFTAHLYRDFIPAHVHHPRHRHNHGAIKMGLMFALIIAMVLLYGGGQI